MQSCRLRQEQRRIIGVRLLWLAGLQSRANELRQQTPLAVILGSFHRQAICNASVICSGPFRAVDSPLAVSLDAIP